MSIILKPEAQRIIAEICVRAALRAEKEAKEKQKSEEAQKNMEGR